MGTFYGWGRGWLLTPVADEGVNLSEINALTRDTLTTLIPRVLLVAAVVEWFLGVVFLFPSRGASGPKTETRTLNI